MIKHLWFKRIILAILLLGTYFVLTGYYLEIAKQILIFIGSCTVVWHLLKFADYLIGVSNDFRSK